MFKKYIIILQIMGFFPFSLIFILSCVGLNNKLPKENKTWVSISLSKINSIAIHNTNQGIVQNIVNQIEPQTPYFAKEDYARFSNNSILLPFDKPLLLSYIPDFDIWIDYRLLNDFVLVFTKPNTDSISGFIEQIGNIEDPKRKCRYAI